MQECCLTGGLQLSIVEVTSIVSSLSHANNIVTINHNTNSISQKEIENN